MAFLFETKAALFAQLRDTVPAGVQCTFAEKGDTNRRRHVFLGSTTDDEMQSAAFRDGPKKPTAVTGYIEVHALSITPGDPMAAERGVYELGDVIAEACSRVDRAAVKGLVDLRPESATVDTTETTDGAYSALTVRVRVRGRVMH